jgi:membrane protein implicated in regulation of membrane protease activity
VDLSSPESWRWIWLIAALVFLVGETVTPAAFFFLPFAAGALVSLALALAGAGVGPEWLAFVGVSGLSFAALWPVGRRLDQRSSSHGVGANRWIGKQGVVLADIPGVVGETGLVRVEREQWRAESGVGLPIPKGATVLVTRVHGTRLVVLPLDDGALHPLEPPSAGSEQGAK